MKEIVTDRTGHISRKRKTFQDALGVYLESGQSLRYTADPGESVQDFTRRMDSLRQLTYRINRREREKQVAWAVTRDPLAYYVTRTK